MLLRCDWQEEEEEEEGWAQGRPETASFQNWSELYNKNIITQNKSVQMYKNQQD